MRAISWSNAIWYYCESLQSPVNSDTVYRKIDGAFIAHTIVISRVTIDQREGRGEDSSSFSPAYITHGVFLFLPLYMRMHTSRCYGGIGIAGGNGGRCDSQQNKQSTWRGFVTRFWDNEILADAVCNCARTYAYTYVIHVQVCITHTRMYYIRARTCRRNNWSTKA